MAELQEVVNVNFASAFVIVQVGNPVCEIDTDAKPQAGQAQAQTQTQAPPTKETPAQKEAPQQKAESKKEEPKPTQQPPKTESRV